ncbi:MAG: peroxiredoxin [Planctomycetes bacterium]|nr:peroxiredoxin [Planctomycetota bacterium]
MDRSTRPRGPRGRDGAALFPFEFRSIDGRGNNLEHADWGAAETALLRTMTPAYGDGVDSPAGPQRPSARAISNIVSAQSGSLPNPLRASDFVWQWGQFLDHDLDETPVADPAQPFDIPVPIGDAWFDPMRTGSVTISLDRSGYRVVDGVRQQVNLITAFLDASNVYGSDDARATELRSLDGTGRLKTSADGLLPYNLRGFANAPTSDDAKYFLAGDIRANEQVGLTAMHTLFVREHNYWADAVRAAIPSLDGRLIYEISRTIVVAEMQAITYREFLPLLLGPNAIPPYRGYLPRVDSGIANIFATAAYRVGHTMLSPQILRLEADGSMHALGALPLAEAFFNPDELSATGIDPILRGLAFQRAQAVDPFVVDDVRNFLFGPPGAGGFDLVALNIQRGRDHGLPTYNDVRQRVVNDRTRSFAELTPDPDIRARLSEAYGDVDDIDAWVGLLAEPRARDAMVGRTLQRVLTEQFVRLRDGDRFWYESYLPPDYVQFIHTQLLSVIIRRNTSIGAELPHDVFRVR